MQEKNKQQQKKGGGGVQDNITMENWHIANPQQVRNVCAIVSHNLLLPTLHFGFPTWKK
jgi:hypothetical protein